MKPSQVARLPPGTLYQMGERLYKVTTAKGRTVAYCGRPLQAIWYMYQGRTRVIHRWNGERYVVWRGCEL